MWGGGGKGVMTLDPLLRVRPVVASKFPVALIADSLELAY